MDLYAECHNVECMYVYVCIYIYIYMSCIVPFPYREAFSLPL